MTNEEIVRQLTENEQCGKANTHRIEELESDVSELHKKTNTIYEINTNIEKMCMSLQYTNETMTKNNQEINAKLDENKKDIKEVKNEVADIKNAPVKTKAKWFDNLAKVIFTLAATGAVGFLLGQFCPAIFGSGTVA